MEQSLLMPGSYLETTELTFQEVWGEELIALSAGLQNFQKCQRTKYESQQSRKGGQADTPSYTLKRLALAEIQLPAVMLVTRQSLHRQESSFKMSSHYSPRLSGATPIQLQESGPCRVQFFIILHWVRWEASIKSEPMTTGPRGVDISPLVKFHSACFSVKTLY